MKLSNLKQKHYKEGNNQELESIFRKIHGIFLTFEPDFDNKMDHSDEVISFYKTNLKEYIKASKEIKNYKLSIVDTISSSDFRAHLNRISEELGINILYIDKKLSSTDAFNYYLANNNNIDDLYLWLASDTRPNDDSWLLNLTNDLCSTNAHIIYPTCTADGSSLTPQKQDYPLNLKPLLVEFPWFFHTICMGLTGQILNKFDWKLPNKYKKNGNCKAISLMALACDEKLCLSFKSNLLHLNAYPFRHNWTDDSFRKDRIQELIHLEILQTGLNAYGVTTLSYKDYLRTNIISRPISITSHIKYTYNFLVRLAKYLSHKDGREKIIKNIIDYYITKSNKERFLTLDFEQRKRLIFDIYWDLIDK
tara:strand:+ start:581 stop:1672 length:1092 start_codon:yes stop_codon:yes gene_type:complete